MDNSKVLNSILVGILNLFGGAKSQPIAAATAANANNTAGTYQDAGKIYTFASLQFIATGLDASDGVIKLQDSNDGTNWNDISGATITVAIGTSSNMIRYTAFTGEYIRANWAKGANTTGTISAIFVFKR
jgi:hypothetical protein